MTDPLVVEFAVQASPEHAFATWTERCAMWWPAGHSLSGHPASITFEPRPGGRIFETATDGTQHDWGTVVAWEPPTRVAYRWHLFFDPSQATDVEVTFRGGENERTIVRLEQRGWERLGDAGPTRRTRTGSMWAEFTALYVTACNSTRRE